MNWCKLLLLPLCLLWVSCSDESPNAHADTIFAEGVLMVDQSKEIDVHPTDSVLISYGIGSGMCIGYCQTDFIFHSWGIEKINTGWAEGGDTTKYPKQRLVLHYKPGQYDSIYATLHTVAFMNGPEYVGCPGCNDGPAESISLQTNSTQKTIRVQQGMTDPSIETLIAYVRKLTEPLYNEN